MTLPFEILCKKVGNLTQRLIKASLGFDQGPVKIEDYCSNIFSLDSQSRQIPYDRFPYALDCLSENLSLLSRL